MAVGGYACAIIANICPYRESKPPNLGEPSTNPYFARCILFHMCMISNLACEYPTYDAKWVYAYRVSVVWAN